MRAILKRALAEARYLPRTVQLVWEATARWTALWLVLLVAQGLLPAVAVYLTKGVVDGLLAATGGDIGSNGSWSALRPLLGPASVLGAVLVLQVLANGAAGWVRVLQTEILQEYISRRIHETSISVGMRFYDFPEFFDHLHRARDEAQHRPAALLEVTGGLLQSAVTLVAVGALLVPYGVWLPVALVVSSLPSLVLVIQGSLRRREWNKRATPQVRKTWYYDYLLTAREVAAEIRVFGTGQSFSGAFQALRRRLRDEQLDLVRREVAGQLLAALLGLTAAAGAAGWVVWQAVQGRVTPGALAMFFAAFVQGQGLMRSLLQNAAQFYTNSLFLGNLFEFLALEQEPAAGGPASAASLTPALTSTAPAPLPRLRSGISFEAVEFGYPGSSRPALSNFNLLVPAGHTVAIVGPNGAGKSTIIKLLCRFYEPGRGRVLIDGDDIRDAAPADVRRLMSVLFQEPVRYAATVHDNVAPVRAPASTARATVSVAVRAAGAEGIVDTLPRGYDTLLGKWFDDGVELSGGEWQRLALARALVRDAPILLLDEPTSAMDSWAEADWFDRFRQTAAGRTTIIITHRFTTAMQADIIHVMEGGRIVESGSHQDLLARGGHYADSWGRQTGNRSAGLALSR